MKSIQKSHWMNRIMMRDSAEIKYLLKTFRAKKRAKQNPFLCGSDGSFKFQNISIMKAVNLNPFKFFGSGEFKIDCVRDARRLLIAKSTTSTGVSANFHGKIVTGNNTSQMKSVQHKWIWQNAVWLPQFKRVIWLRQLVSNCELLDEQSQIAQLSSYNLFASMLLLAIVFFSLKIVFK